MHHTTLLSLVLGAATAVLARPPRHNVHAVAGTGAVKCPVVFDGRIPATSELTAFDSYATSKFNAEYVKGNNLKWSEIIKFPANAGSPRFDNDTHKAFEVTIDDKSIFQQQRGFRRAGLQFQGDTNNNSPGSTGVKTIHFSLKWDSTRPLNLSHEYLVCFSMSQT